MASGESTMEVPSALRLLHLPPLLPLYQAHSTGRPSYRQQSPRPASGIWRWDLVDVVISQPGVCKIGFNISSDYFRAVESTPYALPSEIVDHLDGRILAHMQSRGHGHKRGTMRRFGLGPCSLCSSSPKLPTRNRRQETKKNVQGPS